MDEMRKALNEPLSSFTPEMLAFSKSILDGQNAAEKNIFEESLQEFFEIMLNELSTHPLVANFLNGVNKNQLKDLIKETLEKKDLDTFVYRFKELFADRLGKDGHRILELLKVVARHAFELLNKKGQLYDELSQLVDDFRKSNSKSSIFSPEVKDRFMKAAAVAMEKVVANPEQAFHAFDSITAEFGDQFGELVDEFMQDPNVKQFIDNWSEFSELKKSLYKLEL